LFTGEEPYSIAITIADTFHSQTPGMWRSRYGRHRVALKHAENGSYSGRSISSVSEAQLAAHFNPIKNGQQVKSRLRKMINLRR